MISQKKMEVYWTRIAILRKAEVDIRDKRLKLEAEARKQLKAIMLDCQVADCDKTCESMLCLDVRAMTT